MVFVAMAARTLMGSTSSRATFRAAGRIYTDASFFVPGNGPLALFALSLAMYSFSQVMAGRSLPFL